VTVEGGNILDGIYFEKSSRLSIHGVVYMTVYIHILKVKKIKLEPFKKKDTFVGYIVFHMEIDREE
jgi:hypothetical protein